jgi:predicted ATP-dependent protease
MKITELLRDNHIQANVDAVMEYIVKTAKNESTRLLNKWHKDLKANPNTPHPIHAAIRNIDREMP